MNNLETISLIKLDNVTGGTCAGCSAGAGGCTGCGKTSGACTCDDVQGSSAATAAQTSEIGGLLGKYATHKRGQFQLAGER